MLPTISRFWLRRQGRQCNLQILRPTPHEILGHQDVCHIARLVQAQPSVICKRLSFLCSLLKVRAGHEWLGHMNK